MNNHTISFFASGIPQPKGSKNGYVMGGRAVLVETNAKRQKPWTASIKAAARRAIGAGWELETGAVTIEHITFFFPRPKYHYRTGKRAGELRDNAPYEVTVKPDCDKLLRGFMDALTGIVWKDDAQVYKVFGVEKVYCFPYDVQTAGVDVTISFKRENPRVDATCSDCATSTHIRTRVTQSDASDAMLEANFAKG